MILHLNRVFTVALILLCSTTFAQVAKTSDGSRSIYTVYLDSIPSGGFCSRTGGVLSIKSDELSNNPYSVSSFEMYVDGKYYQTSGDTLSPLMVSKLTAIKSGAVVRFVVRGMAPRRPTIKVTGTFTLK